MLRVSPTIGLWSRPAVHLRDERGQTLVEALVAIVIFAIVATAVVSMLVSSTSITTLAKHRTVAEQGVNNQIERIRAMDYNTVGTTTGNPAGTIQSPVSFTGVNNEDLGVPATLTTSVAFASADVPGSALTGADQKRIVVEIRRNSDSKVLASAVTYLAPKLQASQTTGTVQATVTDIGNNQAQSGTALDNVRVTLTPPSGLNSNEVTDASGTATFGGLTPTSGSQTYSVGIATADMPSFYYAQSLPAFDLAPTQIVPKSIQIYQPVTLKIALTKPDGTPWVGTANITVTAGSGGTTYQWNNVSFTATSTPMEITALGPTGVPLFPNIDYFMKVQASGYTSVTDHSVVPANGSYPAASADDLSHAFTEKMVPIAMGTLDVTATRISSSTGNPFACRDGATIKVYDSTSALVGQGTTKTTSPYDFQLQVPANATYTVQASNSSGLRTGSANATPLPNPPTVTSVPVALSGSQTTGTTC